MRIDRRRFRVSQINQNIEELAFLARRISVENFLLLLLVVAFSSFFLSFFIPFFIPLLNRAFQFLYRDTGICRTLS